MRDYRLRGGFQPVGPMLPYLNDRQRQYFQFKDSMLAAFDQDNPLGERPLPTLMVNNENIVYISVLDQEGIDAAQLLTARHRMIFYTLRFVIKGYVHMRMDEHPLESLNGSDKDFVGITEATLFPLQPVRHSPNMSSPLMFVNRRNVLFYHERGNE